MAETTEGPDAAISERAREQAPASHETPHQIRADLGLGSARLAGSENQLKNADRIREKVANRLAVEPEKTAAEVVRRIPDVIRYTYCSDSARYVSDFFATRALLEARGYELYYSRNFWNHPEYKGIVTRWTNPVGIRFEVQFHTAESYHARHYVAQRAYERIRRPLTSRPELIELHAYQRAVASSVPVPDGAIGIPDYAKDGF